MVQGHDPILGPVRFRYGSHEMYQGGWSSALWQLLKAEKVHVHLWDVNRPEDANTAIWDYPAPSTVSGTMTIGPDGAVKSRSGILREAISVPVSGTSRVTTSVDRRGRHVAFVMDTNPLARSQVGGAPLRWKFKVDGRTVHDKEMESASERGYTLNFPFGLPHRVQLFKNNVKVTDLVVKAAAARLPATVATSSR